MMKVPDRDKLLHGSDASTYQDSIMKAVGQAINLPKDRLTGSLEAADYPSIKGNYIAFLQKLDEKDLRKIPHTEKELADAEKTLIDHVMAELTAAGYPVKEPMQISDLKNEDMNQEAKAAIIKLPGHGFCGDGLGAAKQASRYLEKDVYFLAEGMCAADSKCVAFGLDVEAKTAVLYTTTGCSKYCDNTEWIKSPHLITQQNDDTNKMADCFVKVVDPVPCLTPPWLSWCLLILPMPLIVAFVVYIWHHYHYESLEDTDVSNAASAGYQKMNAFVPPEGRAHTFAMICICTFVNWMAFFIFMATFPKEARLKGMFVAIIGWCLSMFDFGGLFMGPNAPMVVEKFGAKTAIVGANLASGILNILFATFVYIPNPTAFTIMCFVRFLAQGFTLGVMCCAAYGQVAYLYDDEISFASGILESTSAVGVALGPAVGAFLYTLGPKLVGHPDVTEYGFMVAPLLWGILELAVALVNHFKLTEFPKDETAEPAMSNFDRKVIVLIIVNIIGGMGLSTLGPVLQPHLEDALGYSIEEVGFVYTVQALVYAASCIAVGHLDDELDGKVGFLFPGLGAAIVCLGYGMLAPVPLDLSSKLGDLTLTTSHVYLSMILIGIGGGFMTAPLVKMIASTGLHDTEKDRITCAGVLFSMSVQCGTGLGQVIGGWLFYYGECKPFVFTACLMLLASLGIMVAAKSMLLAPKPKPTGFTPRALAFDPEAMPKRAEKLWEIYSKLEERTNALEARMASPRAVLTPSPRVGLTPQPPVVTTTPVYEQPTVVYEQPIVQPVVQVETFVEPVVEYTTAAPVVEYASTPVVEYAAAPVVEYATAPAAPAVTYGGARVMASQPIGSIGVAQPIGYVGVAQPIGSVGYGVPIGSRGAAQPIGSIGSAGAVYSAAYRIP
jgi:MFS family permease